MWLLRICLIAMIVSGIYSVKNPLKAHMFGRKWMYKNEPEPSEMLQDFIRIQGIVFIIIFSIFFLITFSNQ
jgi:hypothetical protein